MKYFAISCNNSFEKVLDISCTKVLDISYAIITLGYSREN